MRKALSLLVASLGLACLLFLTAGCKLENRAQVAGDVINSFAGSCSASGAWSQSARTDTQSLIQIFEDLKSKDACKNLVPILQQMANTTSAIHGVYGDPKFLNYRQTEEELQELTLALTQATDPALIQTLSLAVVEKQKDLAVARASKTVYSEFNDKLGPQDQYSMTTNALSGHFNNLFNYRGELSQCIEQSPSAVMSLFSNLASVAGSFVSPVLGSNMYVLSSMLSQYLGFLRVNEIDKAIFELYESQMPQALTCGLESMTNFYCQAEDAAEIVMTQAESYEHSNDTPTNFWRGIDLVARRLPVLNSWLLKARSGVVPQNEKDSERINEIREKRLSLDTMSNTILGKLNDALRQISRVDDQNIRNDILFRAIAEVALRVTGADGSGGGLGEMAPNPFREFQSDPYQFSCYLARGLGQNCLKSPESGSMRDYISETFKETPFTVEDVINDHWLQILDRVTRNVLNEFNDIVFIDPTSIISNVHEATAQNVSPRAVMVLLRDYLLELQRRALNEGRKHRLALINDTLLILEKSLYIVDDFNPNPQPGSRNPLIDIYDIYKLDFGVQYISDRISELVQYDLQDRLENGEIPTDLEEVIRTSNLEILRRLSAAGVRSLNPVKRDLDMARSQTRANYQVFRKFLFKEIDAVIISEHEKSIAVGESLSDGARRVYGQNVAHLCLLVYSTGEDWPGRSSEKICKESVLFSVYPDKNKERQIRVGDMPKKLTRWKDKPLLQNRNRVCAYYNFLRAERLYEVLKRPSGGGFAPMDLSPYRFMGQAKTMLDDNTLWKSLWFNQ